MENTTEIILGADGFYRRTSQHVLVGKVEDILAEAASSVPTDIPSLFAGPHKTRVHMRATRTRVTLFCGLRHLALNTIWRPYGEGSKQVYPHGAKQEANDFGATYIWLPPGHERYYNSEGKPADGEPPKPKDGDMFLFYIATLNKTGAQWGASDVYLIATRKGDKKFYRLPLNNLYEDGRVCMGSGYFLEGKTLSDQFAGSLKHFESSPWNTDLANHSRPENARAMFSFDLKGKQKTVDGDWAKYCQAVNNGNYADLPGLIIP
jgi:hypothetical protein